VGQGHDQIHVEATQHHDGTHRRAPVNVLVPGRPLASIWTSLKPSGRQADRRSWRISSIRDALDCPDLARLNVICMGLLPDCTASEPSPSALSRTNAGTFVEPEHAPDGGARSVRVGRRDPDGSTYGRTVQETFFAAPDVNGAPRTLHPMRLSPSVRSADTYL